MWVTHCSNGVHKEFKSNCFCSADVLFLIESLLIGAEVPSSPAISNDDANSCGTGIRKDRNVDVRFGWGANGAGG